MSQSVKLQPCITCGLIHDLTSVCPDSDTLMRMKDEEQKRRIRGARPFPGHNRRSRRQMAKEGKLFKDPTGKLWRSANEYMKARRDERLG